MEIKDEDEMARADWESWQQWLDTVFLNKLEDVESSSPEDLASFFLESLQSACNKFIPTKQICRHSKPYWSPKLSQLSDELREALKIFLRQSTPRNKALLDELKAQFKDTITKERNNWILLRVIL